MLMLVQMKALEEPCLTQDQATDQAGSLGKERMPGRRKRRGVRGLDHGPTLSGGLTSHAHLKVLLRSVIFVKPKFVSILINSTNI